MNLYVWDNILTVMNYGAVAYALAESVDQAHELLVQAFANDHGESEAELLEAYRLWLIDPESTVKPSRHVQFWQDILAEPKVYVTPTALISYGD